MIRAKLLQQLHPLKLNQTFVSVRAKSFQFSLPKGLNVQQKRLFSTGDKKEIKGDTNPPNESEKEVVSKKWSFKRIPLPWISLGLATGIFSIFLIIFLRTKNEKQKSFQQKMAGVGKPAIGGPFTLVDHNGNRVTEKDFLGKFLFIYFGFTHCPDICPTELRKMATVLQNIEKKDKRVYNMIQPLFVSVDPARDTPQLIKEYIQEFHPNFLGVTGTNEEIDRICKSYRVYKMKASELSKDDYLLDHSIVIYLMDPSGEFLSFYGNFMDSEQVTSKLISDMAKYLGEDFDKPLWRRILKV